MPSDSDHVAPVGEHHRVHVVGQTVDAAARLPQAEARRDHAVVQAFLLEPVGQVDDADVFRGAAREEAERRFEQLGDVGDLGLGEDGVLQARQQRRPVDPLQLHLDVVFAFEGGDCLAVGNLVRLGVRDDDEVGALFVAARGRDAQADGDDGDDQQRERRLAERIFIEEGHANLRPLSITDPGPVLSGAFRMTSFAISTIQEDRMNIRSVVVLLGAFALLSVPVARAESPAGKAGNDMEKKGNAAEKSADAEKAKGKKMQKKGEAMEEAGDKADNKSQEEAGKKMQKKGKAIEKSGEARHEAAEEMEKSGAKVEKAGAKAEKDSAKAKADAPK